MIILDKRWSVIWSNQSALMIANDTFGKYWMNDKSSFDEFYYALNYKFLLCTYIYNLLKIKNFDKISDKISRKK